MTPVVQRVRAFRERQKSGAAMLAFVPLADEVATIEMLIAVGMLQESKRDDANAVAAAAGRFLDIATKEKDLKL
jgi:hypothetical protein